MSKTDTAFVFNKDNTFHAHMPFAKVNKETRTVSGFASLDNVDKQGDLVTFEASVNAFEDFRKNLREMHQPIAIGKVVSFKPDSYFDVKSGKQYKGVWVDTYVSKGAEDAWEKVLDGTYTGFSIGGNINESHMEKLDNDPMGKPVRVIKSFDLHELSLVDSPANQFANIFSIQKNDTGIICKGMSTEFVTENVFWCGKDEVSSASAEIEKDCVVCGTAMKNIGWVEQADTEKFEAIEKVLDSYLKKDAGSQTITSTGLAGDVNSATNVFDTTVATILYPDHNKKDKVTKSDESLLEGDNNMTEETKTEVVVETIVEVEEVVAPAEEVVAALETIQKSVSISEVENVVDFEKLSGEIKLISESLTKNYANGEAFTKEVVGKFETATTEINTKFAEMVDKYEALNKFFGEVTLRLEAFETASAIKKSSDLEGSTGIKKSQKSKWNGAFLDIGNA